MPGVFRPYTLTDVLGTIQQQAQGDTGTSVSGVGVYVEADEASNFSDSATTTVQANPGWDQGVWGAVTWR